MYHIKQTSHPVCTDLPKYLDITKQGQKLKFQSLKVISEREHANLAVVVRLWLTHHFWNEERTAQQCGGFSLCLTDCVCPIPYFSSGDSSARGIPP